MLRKISQTAAIIVDNLTAKISSRPGVYRLVGNTGDFDPTKGERFSALFAAAPDITKETSLGIREEMRLLEMETPLEEILDEPMLQSVGIEKLYRSRISAAIIAFLPIPDGSGKVERVVMKRPHRGLSDHYRLAISKRLFDAVEIKPYPQGINPEDLQDIHLHQDNIRPGALLRLAREAKVELQNIAEAFSSSDDEEAEYHQQKQQQTPGEVNPEMEIRVN